MRGNGLGNENEDGDVHGEDEDDLDDQGGLDEDQG